MGLAGAFLLTSVVAYFIVGLEPLFDLGGEFAGGSTGGLHAADHRQMNRSVLVDLDVAIARVDVLQQADEVQDPRLDRHHPLSGGNC